MKKRVNFILPNEDPFAFVNTEPSSSQRGSSKVEPSSSIKESFLEESNATPNDNNALVPSSTETAGSSEDVKELCCCCHCLDVRQAERNIQKRDAFLKTPEGQRRLEMRMYCANLFMDLAAMSHVRKYILNYLHGTKELHPSPRVSYPVSISEVQRLDERSLMMEWYIHDLDNVDRYDIFVEGKLSKRIYDPKLTKTVLVDVDVRRLQRIKLQAVPCKGCGSKANPVDKLVRAMCCGHQADVMKNDEFFCQCSTNFDAVEAFYKRNKCKSLVDLWKDSEFLYLPICKCRDDCDCDCIDIMEMES